MNNVLFLILSVIVIPTLYIPISQFIYYHIFTINYDYNSIRLSIILNNFWYGFLYSYIKIREKKKTTFNFLFYKYIRKFEKCPKSTFILTLY